MNLPEHSKIVKQPANNLKATNLNQSKYKEDTEDDFLNI